MSQVRSLERSVRGREQTIVWRVPGLSSMPDGVNYCCFSPSFDCFGRRWDLRLFPNGRSFDHSQGSLSLSLELSGEGPPLPLFFRVGVETERGETEEWGAGRRSFGKDDWRVRVRGPPRSEVLGRRDQLLPGDRLTIVVTMEKGGAPGKDTRDVLVQTEMQEGAEGGLPEKTGAQDVSVQTEVEEGAAGGLPVKTGADVVPERAVRRWPCDEGADAIVKVKGKLFKAHWADLAARAPALCALFQAHTADEASVEESVEDCEPGVFEQLLQYIYEGAPRDLTTANACALYSLAEKYLVEELKEMCVLFMRNTLSLETFCSTLTLCLTYGEEELLSAAADFLSRNMARVMKTVQWQTFLRDHMTWANDILIRASTLNEARFEKEK